MEPFWKCKFGSPINKFDAKLGGFDFGVYGSPGGNFGFRVSHGKDTDRVYFFDAEKGLKMRIGPRGKTGPFEYVPPTAAEVEKFRRLLRLAMSRTRMVRAELMRAMKRQKSESLRTCINEHARALEIMHRVKKAVS